MDTRQPPAPNSYPPAVPWASGPPTAPGQPPPGPPGGYPGGAWPNPPFQPPPQAPRKRGARAAFVGLGALLIVGVMVAAVIFTGAAAKLTGKSSVTATPTTSTAVAQIPLSLGQSTSTTIAGGTAVLGTTTASGRTPNATGTAPLATAITSGGQPSVVATPSAKPSVTRTAGAQATAVGTSSGNVPASAASVNPTSAATPGATPASDIGKAQVHGLNQPVTVPGWVVTVTKVERPGTDLVWSADNDTATATSTWVVVVVTMKKTVNGTDGILSDAFTLRSGQGFTVPVPDDYWMQNDFYATFKHTQPFGKSVPPGATVTYTIPFDVAADATDLRLVFAADANNPAVFAI